jgi:predicted ATP-binding protein involved in virulence
MKIIKIEIIKYRNFENVTINLDEQESFPNVFSIASKNGGGKSTLLQFVFILLHSFMNKNRNIYIKNILNHFSSIKKNIELVKFTIEHNKKIYNLDFSIMNSNYTEDLNFNLFLDLEDTDNKIHQYQANMQEHKQILELKNEIDTNDRMTPVMQGNLRYIQRYLKTARERELFIEAQRTGKISIYKSLIDSIITKNSISENRPDELEMIRHTVQDDLNILEIELNKSDIRYITHLHLSKNVLILKTKMPTDILNLLTNKIFLTAPSSQVFLFLSTEEKHNIFNEFSNENVNHPHLGFQQQSYYESIKRAKQNLQGFYTYDFASTDLILQSFRKANQEDSRIMRKTGTYGTKYNDLTGELKDFLDGKEISENEEGNRVIFKSTHNKKELTPEDLSHGELKKLGIYIWLKYIVDEDSIVLMDEIDIALHPKWQYELVKDLVQWSFHSQFLLATHSPQILSSTYYKNIIKLNQGNVKRYSKPPTNGDINTTIIGVMDSTEFPEDLLKLHKKYRYLVKNKKQNSDEAQRLKELLLEYESEDSSFFDDIDMDIELLE